MSYFIRSRVNSSGVISTGEISSRVISAGEIFVKGASASAYLQCYTSNVANNFTEVGIDTENNNLLVGVTPRGGAYVKSTLQPLVLSGPGGLSNVVLGSANVTMSDVVCNSLTANSINLPFESLSYGSLALDNLSANILTATSAGVSTLTCTNAAMANCIADAFTANNLSITNDFSVQRMTATDVETRLVKSRVSTTYPDGQASLDLHGTGDGAILGEPTNVNINSWYGIGLRSTVFGGNPSIIFDTRHGSMACYSFLFSKGESNFGNKIVNTKQGNGAYFIYNTTSECTVLATRRSTVSTGGGWKFVAQDRFGNLEYGGTVAEISQAGNLALAGDLAVAGSVAANNVTANTVRSTLQPLVLSGPGGLSNVVIGSANVTMSDIIVQRMTATDVETRLVKSRVSADYPDGQASLDLYGTGDGAILGEPTNVNINSWNSIGLRSTFYGGNPSIVFDTRHGSMACYSFLFSKGESNFGDKIVNTKQGNGAYFIYNTTSECTVLATRRSTVSTGGGWKFVAQDRFGNLEYGGTVAEISQAGNLALAGSLRCSGTTDTAALPNGSITFALTNDTTLTVHARGSDGLLRSANLTLA